MASEARPDEDAEVEEIIARAERGELPPNEVLRQRAALLTSSMRSKLSNSWVRLCNVFKSWDDSGDGMVTRQEFIRGLAVLGVAASPADVAELFTALDVGSAPPDGSAQQLDFIELDALMKRGATLQLPPSPGRAHPRRISVGPLGQASRAESRSPSPSPHRARAEPLAQEALPNVPLNGVHAPSLPAAELIALLRSSLVVRKAKVRTLFAEWDSDGSGRISLAEFRGALAAIGLAVPAEAATLLFDQIDGDSSGQITYAELAQQLEQWEITDPPPPATPPRPRGGGRGGGRGVGRRGGRARARPRRAGGGRGGAAGGRGGAGMFGAALEGVSAHSGKEEVLEKLNPNPNPNPNPDPNPRRLTLTLTLTPTLTLTRCSRSCARRSAPCRRA